MARAVLFDMDGVLAFTEQFYNQRRVDYLVGKGFRFDEVPDFSGSNDRAIWESLVPGDAELRRVLYDGYRAYSDTHPTPWRKVANPDAVPARPARGRREVRDLLVLVPGAHTRVHGGGGDGAVREPCHKRTGVQCVQA